MNTNYILLGLAAIVGIGLFSKKNNNINPPNGNNNNINPPNVDFRNKVIEKYVREDLLKK